MADITPVELKIDVEKDDIKVDVDVSGAKAEYKDGRLTLTLPKNANGGGRRVAIS